MAIGGVGRNIGLIAIEMPKKKKKKKVCCFCVDIELPVKGEQEIGGRHNRLCNLRERLCLILRVPTFFFPFGKAARIKHERKQINSRSKKEWNSVDLIMYPALQGVSCLVLFRETRERDCVCETRRRLTILVKCPEPPCQYSLKNHSTNHS